jgi:hypothetical protein
MSQFGMGQIGPLEQMVDWIVAAGGGMGTWLPGTVRRGLLCWPAPSSSEIGGTRAAPRREMLLELGAVAGASPTCIERTFSSFDL